MSTINGKALVKDGKEVDKVFSNGMQVYGRNLLTGTINDIKSTNVKTSMQGANPNILGVYSRTDSYEQVTASSSVETYYRFMMPNKGSLYGLTPGETYTLSGSASLTTGVLKFRAQYMTAISGWISLGNQIDLGIPISDGSVFTTFSYTFTIPVGADSVFFSLQNYNYTVGSLFRFKHMKSEKGSIATPWTPAPEDYI
ncbi:hypothetical protein [Lactococcus lactis]|uniref:hypothetical protein n=1 Tax=Lactococcus lactis TaxID=1358 RepID=UPI0021A60CD9|nr:hypothetical protein [Lactococcus lactis]MCT0052355.1 hypothetical protein [Lactococcus lactis subsp. lactis]